MRVSDILRQKGAEVATIDADCSIAEAAQVLSVRNLGALIVAADGAHIDGIVSERDVVRHLAEHGAEGLTATVAQVMTVEVLTCRRGDPIDHLMAVMTERRVRHLPVVDDAGGLAGIVSIGDVVKRRVEELETENDHLHDYLQSGR